MTKGEALTRQLVKLGGYPRIRKSEVAFPDFGSGFATSSLATHQDVAILRREKSEKAQNV